MLPLILLLITALPLITNAQCLKYWVYFKDKNSEKKVYLSPRSLERRAKQNIPLDITDYPVSETYLNELQKNGLTILRKSKWLNAVSLYADNQQIEKIKSLPFVQKVEPVKRWKVTRPAFIHSDKTAINYGASDLQNSMINIQYLHDAGYKGSGKLIGIFDSGFINAPNHTAFAHVYQNNRVLATRNFVTNDTNVYALDGHGTMVWSCIASYIPDTLVGTGFEAQFILAVTEDVTSETTAEEDNWLAAMEWADSLGVEIINTSLGYNIMDGGTFYTYDDMDGNTTIITRAADLAASKGILCVVSAGNEGDGSWKKITAPCDADSVLCVGSVNFNQNRSSFSSIGPTADGRIKPDIMAMGSNAAVASPNLNIILGSGTSFSAPIITGMAACLWQANPQKNAMEILQAIKASGSKAYQPDTLIGWGIPNAARADSLLKGYTISKQKPNPLHQVKIYPNPAQDYLFFENLPPNTQITILDFCGRTLYQNELHQPTLNLQNLPRGYLLLKLQHQNAYQTYKILLL